MLKSPIEQRSKPEPGEPLWQLAHLYPYQGEWTEATYLALETNHLIEFDNGSLEFLPMPSMQHQAIVAFLYEILLSFVRRHQLGKVFFAPLPLQLWPGKYREPDILFISATQLQQSKRKYPEAATLVVEVVSGSSEDRHRDLITKRQEYAAAGIPEYWIVDPEKKQIIVLALHEQEYREHGIFQPGEQATAVALSGLQVDVTAVFDAQS